MLLGGNEIEWCEHVRYLGVYLMGSKSVKFDISLIKRSFYAACYSVFSHVMKADVKSWGRVTHKFLLVW